MNALQSIVTVSVTAPTNVALSDTWRGDSCVAAKYRGFGMNVPYFVGRCPTLNYVDIIKGIDIRR
jgi:hypothetical protein